ncbi:flagellar basal body P-ring protein FlgI [bacterium]|nr:flagellar basal body P-ring protein FlgI [bacterium]
MKRALVYCTILCVCLAHVPCTPAQVRLKDVAIIKDQREIQLLGYGLVVGLDGTGDGKNTQFTIRTIGNMLKRMGIEVSAANIKVKNVAAVIVTATVSPYVKTGGTFDVTVSSMGDASSLEGGTLLLTPMCATGEMQYATAQGPLSVGGSNRNFGGQTGIVQNKQLVGMVPKGGILERDLPTLGVEERSLMVTLRNPDYTTAYRLATSVNSTFQNTLASARDAGSIVVKIPPEYADSGDIVRFISEMELVTFIPDEKAKVIINERTGTIIAGGNVSLSPVAIMHGTLSVVISEPQAAGAQQPPGQAAQPGQVSTTERMVAFNETANVAEVAKALNVLGATPRDLIAIFQALKTAGSLRAELIVI